jgi:hypothetical protein
MVEYVMLNIPMLQVVGLRRRSVSGNPNETSDDIMPGIERYIVEIGDAVSTPWNPSHQPADTAEAEVLAAAAWTGRHYHACLIGFRALSAQFSGYESDVVAVEWHSCIPKPMILLSTDDNATSIPVNHFIVLRGRNGRDYIIDVCARQFGFRQWFFTAQEYSACILQYQGPVDVYEAFQNFAGSIWHPLWCTRHDYMFLKLLIDQVCLVVLHWTQHTHGRHVNQLIGGDRDNVNAFRAFLLQDALSHAIEWRRNAGGRADEYLPHRLTTVHELRYLRNAESPNISFQPNHMYIPSGESPNSSYVHDMADPTMTWSSLFWGMRARELPDLLLDDETLLSVYTVNAQDFDQLQHIDPAIVDEAAG